VAADTGVGTRSTAATVRTPAWSTWATSRWTVH